MYGTNDHTPLYYISKLGEQITGGLVDTLVVDSIRLNVDPPCKIIISSFSEAECSVSASLTPTPTSVENEGSSAGFLMYILIGAGVFAVIVCACLLVLCVACIACKRRRDKSKRRFVYVAATKFFKHVLHK